MRDAECFPLCQAELAKPAHVCHHTATGSYVIVHSLSGTQSTGPLRTQMSFMWNLQETRARAWKWWKVTTQRLRPDISCHAWNNKRAVEQTSATDEGLRLDIELILNGWIQSSAWAKKDPCGVDGCYQMYSITSMICLLPKLFGIGYHVCSRISKSLHLQCFNISAIFNFCYNFIQVMIQDIVLACVIWT